MRCSLPFWSMIHEKVKYWDTFSITLQQLPYPLLNQEPRFKKDFRFVKNQSWKICDIKLRGKDWKEEVAVKCHLLPSPQISQLNTQYFWSMKTNRKISGGLALISLMSAAFMIFAFASPNWLTLEGNTKGLFQFCPEDRACYSCEEAIAPWMVYSLVFDIFGVVFVFLGRSNADGKKMLMMMIFGYY